MWSALILEKWVGQGCFFFPFLLLVFTHDPPPSLTLAGGTYRAPEESFAMFFVLLLLRLFFNVDHPVTEAGWLGEKRYPRDHSTGPTLTIV
ncbi:hypothetical protein F4778DRAFT_740283 [Xylariomycetidae sp. FL2044]|nr:hypothetical protein F4778DRAFT_740283 [Xylariomycetidae sp. FL2044]